MKPGADLFRKILHIWILLFVVGSTFSIALTQTALFLAFVFWVWIMILEKRSLVPRTPFDFYFLAYIVVGIISLIFSLNPGAMTVVFIKRLLLIPIVYIIAANVTDKKFLQTLLVTLVGVMVVLSFIGIQKYFAGVGGLEGRLKLYHHYMTSGGILMFVSLITLAFTFSGVPRKIRMTALLCGIVMIFPLIFTFTRSSWLGFVGGLLVMGIVKSRKLIVGIVLAIVLFVLFSPHSLRERATSAFDLYHPNNIERTYMWKAGIEIIKDYPITGVGDIDLSRIYDEYKSPDAKERHGHLHNNFIMFGATLGIPGMILFLVLFIKIFIVELKIYNSIPKGEWLLKSAALGSLAAFTGFQINGLFEWNFGDAEIAMLLWLTVGLSLATRKLNKTSIDSV